MEKTENTLQQLVEKYKADTKTLKQASKNLQAELNQVENAVHEAAEKYSGYVKEAKLREENYEQMVNRQTQKLQQYEGDIRDLR